MLILVSAFVENVWDPLSAQETVRLVTVVKRLIKDYPAVSSESKNLKVYNIFFACRAAVVENILR